MAISRPRRLIWGVVTFVLILVAVGLILPAVNIAFQKWPKLGGELHDVDIITGRIRETHYLLYCKLSEKVEDSLLTRTIGQFPDDVQPDWRRVYTLPVLGRHSHHHLYILAISQIRQVDIIWQLCSFSDEAKKHMAQAILTKWQTDGKASGAEEYIRHVWDMAREKTEADPKAVISVADLAAVEKKQPI